MKEKQADIDFLTEAIVEPDKNDQPNEEKEIQNQFLEVEIIQPLKKQS